MGDFLLKNRLNFVFRLKEFVKMQIPLSVIQGFLPIIISVSLATIGICVFVR